MVVFAAAYMEMAGQCQRLQSTARQAFCAFTPRNTQLLFHLPAFKCVGPRCPGRSACCRHCAVPPTHALLHKACLSFTTTKSL